MLQRSEEGEKSRARSLLGQRGVVQHGWITLAGGARLDVCIKSLHRVGDAQNIGGVVPHIFADEHCLHCLIEFTLQLGSVCACHTDTNGCGSDLFPLAGLRI
jgi:hypothetical protein